ncbi:MAG TPA: adenylosuccinate lyase [Halanaerobiales bacterium]|nr:adenylosuccinate lyase [Halanaerobiales bacterium]
MLDRYSRAEMKNIFSEENKFQKWLDVELAVVKARQKLGEVPEEAYQKIADNASFEVARIKEIEKETRHDMLAFIETVNENLGNEAKYIHEGITSNDIKDTGLALQLSEALDLILKDLRKLKRSIKEKALLHKKTVMIGRTHGIHAEPITFGLKLAVWFKEIERHEKRFNQLAEVIKVGQISGAVGTYATINPEVEKLVMQELNLDTAMITNQILQRDRHADLMSKLSLAAASLEKFATEIRNLQRTDILEVEENFSKGQKGSSAMPHKKNPIVTERISGLARVIRGNLIPAFENVNLWHERDLTHSSVERIILPDSFILLDYMINKFKDVLDNLKVNEETMQINMNKTNGLIYSQKVMLALIDKGLKRERAYELVQRNALKAWENNESFQKKIENDGEVMTYLNKEELNKIFDYENFIKEVDYIFERGKLK